MEQRVAFIVRVEPGGGGVTVEDVRGARAARLNGLSEVGRQIERWLAPLADSRRSEPDPPERRGVSAGASESESS